MHMHMHIHIHIYIYIDSLLLYICSERDLLRGVIIRLWRPVPAAVLIVLRASRPHGRLTFAVYMQ